MKMPMMKCGHTANAEQDGKPVCVICYGSTEDACVILECSKVPNLEGRKAACGHCNKIVNSDYKLAFFTYRSGPEYERCKVCKSTLQWHNHPTMGPKTHEFIGSGEYLPDSYYCGCSGWD